MAQQAQAVAVHSRARTNPYYRAALQDSPQYVEATALRAKLLEAQQSLPGAPAVAAPEKADDDLAEWLNAVAETDAAQRAREIKFNAIRERLIWCDKVVEDVVTVDTDRILTSLHDALMEVMDQVAAVVDRLDGARTPEQVIDRGVGDVWKELRPLRNDYDQIRTAQSWSMDADQLAWHRSKYLLDDPLAADTTLRNLDQLFPAWREPDRSRTTFSDAPQADPRPWPQDPISQLVWIATSEAEPWVPTLSELNQLNRQRTSRLNPPPDKTEATHPKPKQTFGRVTPQRAIHI